MTDSNFSQQASDFAADAVIDTQADQWVNQSLDAIAAHIPGAEMIEQQLKTETDQVLNHAINTEINQAVQAAEERMGGLSNSNQP